MTFTSLIAGASALMLSLLSNEPMKKVAARVFERAAVQCEAMDARLAADATPRSYNNGKNIDANLGWWCSGFFPGTLWYIYEYTGDEKFRALADKNTLKLEKLVEGKTDHDIGFQVNCSYGNALRLTGDQKYKPIIDAAAAKLCTRFNPTVGCIKSWDNKRWEYPVIIDNMMNLELLMNASKLFGKQEYADVANTHAKTTAANHFRPDYSCYHLVGYSTKDGSATIHQTVQGFADESAWSRGQAWGLYGYVMMYRETGDPAYLEQAENIAGFIIPLLPDDGVAYWDFNAPGTPMALPIDAKGAPANLAWDEGTPVLRDVSAGAIMASAFVDLSRLTRNRKAAGIYRKLAETIIRTLASDEYLAAPGTNGCFVLKHGVGHLPGNSEVDVPLSYADYYFLEAILKYLHK